MFCVGPKPREPTMFTSHRMPFLWERCRIIDLWRCQRGTISIHGYVLSGQCSMFCVGSQVRHNVSEEGQRTYRPKLGEYNNEDGDNSPNIQSDKIVVTCSYNCLLRIFMISLHVTYSIDILKQVTAILFVYYKKSRIKHFSHIIKNESQNISDTINAKLVPK